MTGQADQRLITSGTPAGFATRAGADRTIRSTILSLVLILLIGLAVVQTVVLHDPRWTWAALRDAAPGVLAAAAVQTVLGFLIGTVLYRLAPRAGLVSEPRRGRGGGWDVPLSLASHPRSPHV